MAEFELNIYGENDEVIKRYETDHIRWGVFLKAIELEEKIKEQSQYNQFFAINSFMKSIFVGLTDEELEQADGSDVVNTFKQLTSKSIKIKSPKNA